MINKQELITKDFQRQGTSAVLPHAVVALCRLDSSSLKGIAKNFGKHAYLL